MSIATIIVNFNAGDTLKLCIDALLDSTVQTDITVVDNASSDGSVEELREIYASRQGVELLFNPVNSGFAAAVNMVAHRLDASFILILNPDCILGPATLERLQAALKDDPHAGLAGPAVYDEHGEIQGASMRCFPDPWKSLMTTSGLWRMGKRFPAFNGVEIDVSTLSGDPIICDAVSGACILVRRSAFETVGYLDEEYAMHCEDLDLMFRLRQQNLHCLYVPEADCVHQQGLSSRSRPTWVHFQKHRGMHRFFGKFQAEMMSFPSRLLVYTGIWLRFVILWPIVLIRR